MTAIRTASALRSLRAQETEAAPTSTTQASHEIPRHVPLANFDAYASAWQGQVRENTNCYNYAVGCITDAPAVPGTAAHVPCKIGGTRNPRLIEAAEADGLQAIDEDNNASSSEEQRMVALCIAPKKDFHWLLKHPDGTWSHKMGSRSPRNTDADGKIITDPQEANLDFSTQNSARYFFWQKMIVPGDVKIA